MKLNIIFNEAKHDKPIKNEENYEFKKKIYLPMFIFQN